MITVRPQAPYPLNWSRFNDPCSIATNMHGMFCHYSSSTWSRTSHDAIVNGKLCFLKLGLHFIFECSCLHFHNRFTGYCLSEAAALLHSAIQIGSIIEYDSISKDNTKDVLFVTTLRWVFLWGRHIQLRLWWGLLTTHNVAVAILPLVAEWIWGSAWFEASKLRSLVGRRRF